MDRVISLLERPSKANPLARNWARHRVAIVTDPRFPGGTSAAVAAEIRALARAVDLRVVAIETRMFKDRIVHPAIEAACAAHGITVEWDPAAVHADTVILHNPSCLRFDTALALRISCTQAFVVTHENFLRPGGAEGFDVAGCLRLIEGALACGTCPARAAVTLQPARERGLAREQPLRLAPRPAGLVQHRRRPMRPPSERPSDRRGRHSRPGFEKFPPLADLERHFPPTAERCVILGGDHLLLDLDAVPAHWEIRRFGHGEVDRFLADVDFLVYFTSPCWRESFGRVVAEGIAAGKVVITDPGTAEAFGDAVLASDGSDVDALVAAHLDPSRYRAVVLAAQASLERFRPAAFRAMVTQQITAAEAIAHALV
jgi:hypothetical protein